MTEASVLVGRSDDVATITLNRPERMNAFNDEMLDRLALLVEELNADANLAGVIVTGAGRAFCAGRDRSGLAHIAAAESARALPSSGGHESSMFAAIEVPVVAAVNGAAVGGGLGFVVQCDYVMASTDARFADGHLTAGMAPSVASWYLPRRIGGWRALRLFTATSPMDALAAHELGIVDEVVAPEELVSKARARIEPFRGTDRELLRHTKRLVMTSQTGTFAEQMERVGLLRSMERRMRLRD